MERGKICDLATGFYRVKEKFEIAFEEYRKKGSFNFKAMDEMEKDLYHLKNEIHAVFRYGEEKSLEREHLFDLIIGSIFHEALHVKEYIYTLESYAARYRLLEKKRLRALETYQDEFIKYSKEIVEEAKKNLPRKTAEVKNLFEEALSLLENILRKYRSSRRIIRCLYLERELLDRVYGKNGLNHIYGIMYKGGPMEGYFRVGASFLKDGFYEPAVEAFQEALHSDCGVMNGDGLRQEIKKRCLMLQKKKPGIAKKILAKIG